MYSARAVSDLVARQALLFAARYVRKWSGPDSEYPLSPEAREEIVCRIIYDWQTADYGEWQPENDLHAVASWCRQWRMRGWHGNTADDHRERRRTKRSPGDAPYSGASMDARSPTPLALLIAQEEASRGLRFVSDRQRKARRKAVRTRSRYETLLVVEGRYEAHTAIRWERVRIHGVGWKGTVANRAIGKSKTDPVPGSLAVWALQPRDERGRFVPQPLPASRPWTPDELANLTTPPRVPTQWVEVSTDAEKRAGARHWVAVRQ